MTHTQTPDALLARASAAYAHLSPTTRSIWGKSDYGAGEAWLPLCVHAVDTASVMDRLWHRWLPEATRQAIARAIGTSQRTAARLCVFLACVHDVGKATPSFQAKDAGLASRLVATGLPVTCAPTTHPTHPLAGELVLRRYLTELGCACPDALSGIVGAHHGNVPSRDRLYHDMRLTAQLGWADGSPAWHEAQRELVGLALRVAGLLPSDLRRHGGDGLGVACQSLLAGLVVMADWVASDETLFPLVPQGGLPRVDGAWLARRVDAAWRRLDLVPAWSEPAPPTQPAAELLASRFQLPRDPSPRPVQEAAVRLARDVADPGLMVVEAPMGEGKTEAALMAAEILACRCRMGGVCVALPTMATTDAMFDRVADWLARLPHRDGLPDKSVCLAHGKANLNERYSGLVDASRRGDHGATDDAVVSEWMRGRRRGMLSNFVVCTVDQVLMAALAMRHLGLRQLAVACKVVVIDECHAYDLHMRQYLNRLLQWLGYWHVPVILLSATLPAAQREAMTGAYVEGRRLSLPAGTDPPRALPQATSVWERIRRSQGARGREAARPAQPATPDAYPRVTCTDGASVSSHAVAASGRAVDVRVDLVPDDVDGLVSLLADELSGGGCAGVVCDTVGRAQAAYVALREAFGPDVVTLDHARLTDADRMGRERWLRAALGPSATRADGLRPPLSVVVGTQVLEQSLDLDFDVLVTDVAPTDLMLQRMGRLHRHRRGDHEDGRPPRLRQARCHVRGVTGIDHQGPSFARGLVHVYDEASLTLALATLGLTAQAGEATVSLPADIARLVRVAYDDAGGASVPEGWAARLAVAERAKEALDAGRRRRAEACLVASLAYLGRVVGPRASLLDLAQTNAPLEGPDAEGRGLAAVRDAGESLEVLLVEEDRVGGRVLLPPWAADAPVARRALPLDAPPDREATTCLLGCAVRLPWSVCPPEGVDAVADEVGRRCRRYTTSWQDSPWLARRLLLPLRPGPDGTLGTELMGWDVTYTSEMGLVVTRHDIGREGAHVRDRALALRPGDGAMDPGEMA